VKKEDLDKEILRAGIIAELDAINLYEQMAALAKITISRRFFSTSPKRRRPISENS
jgi:rubrerythrin